MRNNKRPTRTRPTINRNTRQRTTIRQPIVSRRTIGTTRQRTTIRQPIMNTACIISIIKYEHDFLNQWLEYHIKIGFSHFSLFSAES